MENVAPPPLPVYRSGNRTLDEAIRIVQLHGDSEEPHVLAAYERLVDKLVDSEKKHLVALIVPQACDFGSHGWDEGRANAMSPTGLLSFFVDDESEQYLKKAVVVHSKPLKGLIRTAPPKSFQKLRGGKPARQPYAACAVTLVPTLTMPSPSNPNVTKALSAEERKAYAKRAIAHPLVSQVLGYRNHGYDAENPISARLLLRVISDPQADMSWGDAEYLDFYVPIKALSKGDFSKVYPYVGD